MRKFIVNIIIFFAIIWIADIGLGAILDKIAYNAKSGGQQINNHITYKANEEIIIMGSSRASHHYIPQIINDSLKMSSYNMGQDAMGIILMYGRYKLLTERYDPKIIVYDINEFFDLGKNDNIKYIAKLRQNYDNTEIKNIFNTIDKKESTKMYSKLYRYNSRSINVLQNALSASKNDQKGYLPLYGTMDYEPRKTPKEKIEYDSIKLKYLEELIIGCKNKSKLVFAISPTYFEEEYDIKPLNSLCIKYNIPILDYSKDERFIEKKELFKDCTHLNDEGAKLYTNIIIQEIKKLL